MFVFPDSTADKDNNSTSTHKYREHQNSVEEMSGLADAAVIYIEDERPFRRRSDLFDSDSSERIKAKT